MNTNPNNSTTSTVVSSAPTHPAKDQSAPQCVERAADTLPSQATVQSPLGELRARLEEAEQWVRDVDSEIAQTTDATCAAELEAELAVPAREQRDQLAAAVAAAARSVSAAAPGVAKSSERHAAETGSRLIDRGVLEMRALLRASAEARRQCDFAIAQARIAHWAEVAGSQAAPSLSAELAADHFDGEMRLSEERAA
jgi:hypothetical protein